VHAASLAAEVYGVPVPPAPATAALAELSNVALPPFSPVAIKMKADDKDDTVEGSGANALTVCTRTNDASTTHSVESDDFSLAPI
jgi:hypothetical protein